MTNRPGPKTVEIVALGAYNAIHSPGHSAYQETATGRASLTKPPSGKARLPGSAPEGVRWLSYTSGVASCERQAPSSYYLPPAMSAHEVLAATVGAGPGPSRGARPLVPCLGRDRERFPVLLAQPRRAHRTGSPFSGTSFVRHLREVAGRRYRRRASLAFPSGKPPWEWERPQGFCAPSTWAWGRSLPPARSGLTGLSRLSSASGVRPSK